MKASQDLLADVAIGLTAGLVATRMTGSIQKMLYKLMPESVKRREEQVRPGSPTRVAARKLAAAADVSLTEQQAESAATAIHYGSGVPWGTVYTFLRRHSGMTPLGAALASARPCH